MDNSEDAVLARLREMFLKKQIRVDEDGSVTSDVKGECISITPNHAGGYLFVYSPSGGGGVTADIHPTKFGRDCVRGTGVPGHKDWRITIHLLKP